MRPGVRKLPALVTMASTILLVVVVIGFGLV